MFGMRNHLQFRWCLITNTLHYAMPAAIQHAIRSTAEDWWLGLLSYDQVRPQAWVKLHASKMAGRILHDCIYKMPLQKSLVNQDRRQFADVRLLDSAYVPSAMSTTPCSLCAQILRVRYETPSEWLGLIKAQQETVRVGNYDPKIIVDAFKRGQDAGNKARLVVQVQRVACLVADSLIGQGFALD